jgi:ribosomal protein S18 acetylase RimI-like enzyme
LELSITQEIDPHVAAFLDLESQASASYSNFVYADAGQAEAVRALLWRHRATEFGPPYARLLLEGRSPVGMMACLTQPEILGVRLQAAMLMKRLGVLDSDPHLQNAFRLAARTLIKPVVGDYYLSRIAVVGTVRRRGLGRHLMQAFAAEGRRRACARLTLEVDSANLAAIRLYESCGFSAFDRVRASDEGRHRTFEYLHFQKPLD